MSSTIAEHDAETALRVAFQTSDRAAFDEAAKRLDSGSDTRCLDMLWSAIDAERRAELDAWIAREAMTDAPAFVAGLRQTRDHDGPLSVREPTGAVALAIARWYAECL